MTTRMLTRRLIRSAMALFVWLSLEVCSWSLKPSQLSPPSGCDRVDRAQSLLQSLKGGKSHFHPGIQVVSVGGDECGIRIQNGPKDKETREDDVIFVDRKEFLTPQTGIETPMGQALEFYLSHAGNSIHAHSTKLPHIYLGIYLTQYKLGLLDTVASSAMADYLETLPSSSELLHLPLFWEDSMLEELQCSIVKDAVQSRREEWKQEFLLVQTAIQAVGMSSLYSSFTLETWNWARSIVTSRAFTDSGNHDYPCLCPYVDMMNHVTSNQLQGTTDVVKCTWDIDSKGYHLRLPRMDNTLLQTPRLEISYGCHSNAHFLMNYGFSILDDQEQVIEELATLPVLLPDSVHEIETESLWEADGLGDCHLIARNVTVGIGDAGPIESVLSLCRVASAQQIELSRMKEIFLKRDQRTTECNDGLVPQLGATLCRTPFSVTNEIRALHMLQATTQTALGRYSTTMDEDTDILLAGQRRDVQPNRKSPMVFARSMWNRIFSSIGHNTASKPIGTIAQWHNAVTVRREEKKILQHYFLLASIGLNFLEYSTEDEHFEAYKGMLEASLQDREPLVVV